MDRDVLDAIAPVTFVIQTLFPFALMDFASHLVALDDSNLFL
jgi:hypothetical protein